MAQHRVKILLLTQILSASCLFAQLKYDIVKKETVQQRLDLYKGNDTTRERALATLFKQAGCANLSEQPVPERKQPNVICVLPGSTPETIVIGGHFDHVDAGDGIVDNWSGASILPSLFQSIAGSKPRHAFIFVGFTGEEEGLLGSEFYVHQLPKGEISNIEVRCGGQ